MQEEQVVASFAALAQETRLRIIRLLVQADREGMAAGAIAEAVGVSASNVSFHLKDLERAELVRSRREARSIIYNVDFGTLTDLLKFLMRDCCGGRPEICSPLINAVRYGPDGKRGSRHA